MTNTIPNVPRELLERIIQFRWIADDLEVKDCRKELRALLSAPSPAGVDGLEVVAWLCEWMGDKCGGVYSGLSKTSLEGLRRSQGEDVLIVSDEPLCRLSDAEAIIDGLRGEVAALRKAPCECGAPVGYVSGDKYHAEHERLREYRSERDQQAQRIGELEGLLREVRLPDDIGRMDIWTRIDAALSADKEVE